MNKHISPVGRIIGIGSVVPVKYGCARLKDDGFMVEVDEKRDHIELSVTAPFSHGYGSSKDGEVEQLAFSIYLHESDLFRLVKEAKRKIK